MKQKIRTSIGCIGLSLLFIINSFSVNRLVVNAEEPIQESTDIQEEYAPEDPLSEDESKPEDTELIGNDLTDTESTQIDNQLLDNTTGETLSDEIGESSSEPVDINPKEQKDEQTDVQRDKITPLDNVIDNENDAYYTDSTETDAVWSIEEDGISAFLSDYSTYICIVGNDYNNTFTAESSNSEVVSLEDDTYYGVDSYVHLYLMNPGTATITITDKYGKKQTCTITVYPDPISFGDNQIVNYNDYWGSGDGEIFEYYLETVGDNIIKAVNSSNTNVVTVQRKKCDWSDEYYLEVTPVGTGSAVITATDQYGQNATIQVTVTQKYIDEKRYYRDLCWDAYVSGPEYGETQIRCYCNIIANIYTTINGKKYTGNLQADGCYYIKGIPRLPAGTKITVYFQKGNAVFSHETTVYKTYGVYLPLTIKARTYSGKAQYPAVTIKNGNITLKKGTDYTLKYWNNKNIGSGKVTIAFIGNYTGAKVVSFNINPPKTNLTKTSGGKKYFTVHWKTRKSQITGYQIQYSTNKLFKYGNKIITIGKKDSSSKKVTGLQRKTTYYVRIRTYKKVGKKPYFSGWSTAMKVKTK